MFNRDAKEAEVYPMKKSYLIEVDCANCALKAEEAAKKTPGVENVIVNFMAQKMIVEFADGQDPSAVMRAVAKNCKKAVSDFEIQV